MQSTMDNIKKRTERIYLSHPFMWRFEKLYYNAARLIRRNKAEDFPDSSLVKIIKDFMEEKRIAVKYGFAKRTPSGYKMIGGIPIEDFPDSEFEERYDERKLRS